jgi:hypothetical protein
MFAEMEAGLVSMVEQSPLKQKLARVDTLPDLDGDNLVKRMAADAPAVYVVAGHPYKADSGVLAVPFGLACVARNARGHEDARRGDGKVIGLYGMLEGVIGLAENGRAGGCVWRVAGVDFMNDDKLFQAGLTVGVVRVETSATMPAGIDETALANFATLRTDYDIPPHVTAAEHGKWAGDPQDFTTGKPELQDTQQLQ